MGLIEFVGYPLVEFNSVLHHFSRTKVSVSHAFELCEHCNELIAIRRILVRLDKVFALIGLRNFA